MSDQHRKEYLGRVHRAQDTIEKNLGNALSLGSLPNLGGDPAGTVANAGVCA